MGVIDVSSALTAVPVLPRASAEQKVIITDQLFRQRWLELAPGVNIGSRLLQTLLPPLLFFSYVAWPWLCAWLVAWGLHLACDAQMARRYRQRYPAPLLPAEMSRWEAARVVHKLIGWSIYGLVPLFCFQVGSATWEIAAMAGAVMILVYAPYDSAVRAEIVAANAAMTAPLLAMLLWRGTPLHLTLAALTVAMAVILMLWGMQQIAATRNEMLLRLSMREAMVSAEQANLAKSKFLAAASHDLRQPLHAMTLFIAALDDRIEAAEPKKLVDSIRHCAAALESLLQTLLDISKIDAGIVVPEVVDFKLAPLVERLCAEHAMPARTAGLRLMAQCGNLTVRSDPALVEAILRNLLGNGIRYTHAGSVEILCTPTTAGIEVAVRDTGVGIPAEQHGRVFDEFVQLANPERDRTKGLGLGLAIVRRLASLLCSEVTLESEPGKGSVFRFTLPIGDPAAIVDEAPPAMLPSLLEESVIVVVDDEAAVRAGMQVLLEGWGCRVVVADSDADAIARLQADGLVPQIVVADYRLREGKTGVDAIRRIAAHFGTAISGVIITGDTASERLGEAKASGYILLHKPVAPGKLRALLQNLRRGKGQGTSL